MFNRQQSSRFFSPRRRSKLRRPQSISRRQKKLFSFEALEDRRVMSANSAIDGLELVSYSSADLPGELEILARELQKHALFANVGSNSYVSNSIPTDPLLPEQWHLINTGQEVGQPNFQDIFAVPGNDINVAPVWEAGYSGEGIVIAVVDTGVERLHPDLVGNIHPTLQLDALDLDGDANPEVFEFDIDNQLAWQSSFQNAHGTSVAGIIAASADNGLGGTGIAFNSELVPIRLIDSNVANQSEQSFIDTFRFRIDEIDITNNSWGPEVVRGLDGPTPNQILALRDSVFFGRDGLGVIHVFSAGNDGLAADSAGYNGWINSRYTIGVTSVDHDGEYNNVDGTVTGLPETGPSVLVAAYDGSGAAPGLSVGNDTSVGSGIITTDTTGNTGFNISPDPDTGQEFELDFQEDIDFTSRFGDTSAAAPQVSAVIALMLEANPNLSWRDVQEILVRSSSQVSKFATQADGLDKVRGIEYQNTWIVNQVPLFHDPDPFDPLIPNELQLITPTLNPLLSYLESDDEDAFVITGPDALSAHYVPTPHVLTNGAGYTVSQGRGTNFEQTGFAHGVVDAELAVALAEQWHIKGQNLPDELSFTTAVGNQRLLTLPSAEVTNAITPGTNLIVPGGLDGDPGFVAYWNEYLSGNPDFDPANIRELERGVPLEFEVPSPNDMIIETVEITVQITGGDVDFLDNVRVVLVSPTGTHSELNHYFVDPSFGAVTNVHQPAVAEVNGLNGLSDNITDFIDPGSVDNDPGDLQFTFTTNRNWGERSDSAIIFDPTTNEPIIDTITGQGGNIYNITEATAGDLLTQGWQLHMENYGTADLTLSDFEVVWHGSPIEPNTERVQGLIGIDDNRDDLFNYSRVIQQITNFAGDDPDVLRLGEVVNIIDPNHESMAANITVLAYADVGNTPGEIDEFDILVDQFVTGADGNYYFDLVPGDYVFTLDDATLGSLTPLDDSLTPEGLFIQDYKSEWAITEDYFQVWDYDANLEAPIDPLTQAPLAFLDGSLNPVTTGVKNLNFLLDPGEPAVQQATFNGSVIADFNGDGVFNGNDIAVPGINVFVDANRNGQFDAGENLTSTDANGQYSLIADPVVSDTVLNIGVIAPVDWTNADPDDGLEPFFVQVGDVFNDVDFSLTPPFSSNGNGGNQPGILLGSVFDDVNQDTLRQASEQGLANVTVFIDGNNSGALEPGEVFTTTNSNGAYVFGDLLPGSYAVRIDLSSNPELEQTSPFTPFGSPIESARIVSIQGDGTVTNVEFGVFNSAVLDFGDLPAVYGVTTLANDGARHSKGVYFLGSRVDTELNGQPSALADADDLTLDDDEDGIVLATLSEGPQLPGATSTLTATASRYGGYLQGWIDFNADGDFDDAGERILEDFLLPFGTSVVTYDLPSDIAPTDVFARFRYGEFGLELTGPALIGEVEDYLVDIAPPIIASINADANNDGRVGGQDFMAWLRGYGTSQGANPEDGDTNGDGQVNGTDLENLQAEYGTSYAAAAAASAEAPSESSEASSGSDFLAWIRGFGTSEGATAEEGDNDQDGDVDGEDLIVVLENFGNSGESQSIATASFAMAASVDVAIAVDPADNVSDSGNSTTESQVVSSANFIGLSGTLLNKESDLSSSQSYVVTAARLDNDSANQSIPVARDIDSRGNEQDEALDSIFDAEDERIEYASGDLLDSSDESEDPLETAFSGQTNWRLF